MNIPTEPPAEGTAIVFTWPQEWTVKALCGKDFTPLLVVSREDGPLGYPQAVLRYLCPECRACYRGTIDVLTGEPWQPTGTALHDLPASSVYYRGHKTA